MTGYLHYESATRAWLWYASRKSRFIRFLQRRSWLEMALVGIGLTALLVPLWLELFVRVNGALRLAPHFWITVVARSVLIGGLYGGLKSWLGPRTIKQLYWNFFGAGEGIFWGHYEMSDGSLKLARVERDLASLEILDSPYGRIYLQEGRFVIGGLPVALSAEAGNESDGAERSPCLPPPFPEPQDQHMPGSPPPFPLQVLQAFPPRAPQGDWRSMSRPRKAMRLAVISLVLLFLLTSLIAGLMPFFHALHDDSSPEFQSRLLHTGILPGQLSLVSSSGVRDQVIIYRIESDAVALADRIAASNPRMVRAEKTITPEKIEMRPPVWSGKEAQEGYEIDVNEDYVVVRGY